MVKGLDRFRVHFEAFSDRFLLIGGTACDLIMRDVGLQFRATKDLDIVLCIESIDQDFARAFWGFVKAGQYEIQESASGKPRFYRFQKPADSAYPAMLELFSTVPEALSIPDGGHLTPIPIDGGISSLSAILLDPDYYDWVRSGRRVIGGLPVVGPEHLIPLKARAWLDLRARKRNGEHVDSRAIKKHRNDIFRLFQVVDPQAGIDPPGPIVDDMRTFLESLPGENVDLRSLGLRTITVDTLIEELRRLYQVAPAPGS